MNTRINKFVAQATGLSRRQADKLIEANKIYINNRQASLGDIVSDKDEIKLDGKPISSSPATTIMLNKPVGYVCSRDGQGSKTIYDLLPQQYQNLKPVGRLDKNSSGLLLLTSDGDLAFKLTHPSFVKNKIYSIVLDKDLAIEDENLITESGVDLSDGVSKLELKLMGNRDDWQVTMHEGRNRQIRRTFESLGYQVRLLHRLQLDNYSLDSLAVGEYKQLV